MSGLLTIKSDHLPIYTSMNNIFTFQEKEIISKSGAWQNTNFYHLVDDPFGSTLAQMLQQVSCDWWRLVT